MDYKEKYEALLEQVKSFTPDEKGLVLICPSDLFPELKESEDGRIRKALIRHLKVVEKNTLTINGVPMSNILAWLEKPGNIDYKEELQKCKDNPLYFFKNYCRVSQKDASWSKEDDRMIHEIILDLAMLKSRDTGEAGQAAYQKEIDWLKDLQYYKKWKPMAGGMNALKFFIGKLENTAMANTYAASFALLRGLYEDLKGL